MTTLASQDTEFYIAAGLPGARRGVIKVEWVDLGEGRDGDYDPGDPEDEQLLRFDLYRLSDEGVWEEVPDGSYCTNVCLDTPVNVLQFGAKMILDEVHAAILADGRAKRAVARLSHLSTKYLLEQYNAHANK